MSARPPRGRGRLINFALAGAATAAILLLAEPVLRLRYVEPAPDRPVVREVQKFLRLDSVAGFSWVPNITPEQGVRFDNADIVAPPLSTDEFGVINPPEAIAKRRAGETVDVLGLGDSFMEMAAPDFQAAFAGRGMSYYSLAIHRQAPPHYARIFDAHGIGLRPTAVLIGLFENDFAETEDFDRWQDSGLDWFAFHSGTWCGPPVRVSAVGRLYDRWFRGYQGLARVIRSRARGDRMSVSGPGDAQVRRVADELGRVASAAEANSIAPWLVLIPSKPTARGERTAESNVYDRVVDAVGSRFAGVIDLRPVFQAHPDPASLYYREDGHWNPAGVDLAAREILGRILTVTDESGSD